MGVQCREARTTIRETQAADQRYKAAADMRWLPGAIGLQLAHSSVLDVNNVALADLHLYIFILIKGYQKGPCWNGICELTVLHLPLPAA